MNQVIKNIDHDSNSSSSSSTSTNIANFKSDAVGNLVGFGLNAGADFGDLFSSKRNTNFLNNFSTSTSTSTSSTTSTTATNGNNNKITKENLLEKVDALNKTNNLINSNSHKSGKASLINKLFYYSSSPSASSTSAVNASYNSTTTTNNNVDNLADDLDGLNFSSLRNYLNVKYLYFVYTSIL